MALNKSKVKTNASEVAKTEATKSDKMLVENILIENLVPDPNNGEDVENTADLEYSIKHNGFNDPIVVTSFGMEDGKYRIVSGHRRTEAMKRLNNTAIPCFIREFNSEEEVRDAREAFNLATRDSMKDPMLYVNRWRRFADERKSEKIGDLKKMFAEMADISVARVQRLITTAKLISDIQIMIQSGEVGESSCEPIAPLDADNQKEIYTIMKEASEDVEGVLTRPNVKKIVEAYKNGKKTWAEIKEIIFPKEVKVENHDDSHGENNDDFDGMNPPTNDDYDDEEDSDDDVTNHGNHENGSSSNNDDEEDSDDFDESDAGVDSNELEEVRLGRQIRGQISKLENNISKEFYSFGDEDTASEVILEMLSLSYELLVRAEEVANKEYDDKAGEFMYSDKIREVFRKAMSEHSSRIKDWKF